MPKFPAVALRKQLAVILLVSALASCVGSVPSELQDDSNVSQPAHLRVGAPGTAIWAPPITFPLVPASAANRPDGKVLFWSADDRFSFGTPGSTHTAVFDPVSGLVTQTLITATGHNMFCPGTTNLADGRLLVNGGIDSGKTSLYDPVSGAWSASFNMNITRGYNANTILQDGSVFTLGGSWSGGEGGKNGEVWTEATGWRRLSGVPVAPMLTNDTRGGFRSDNHMWLIPAGNGRVFHAGPSAQMNWIDTTGDGQVQSAGLRGDDTDSMSGIAVMYDVGKILKAGGSTSYEGVNASAAAYVVDVNGPVGVRKVAPMAFARAFHNSVVLPNGQVVIVGGQTFPQPFSDDRAVLAAELWDPTSETFTSLPPMVNARTYHSVALLLPDGRVMSAGGGLCGGCSTNHPNAEILTPPYLLNQDGTLAARPSITSAPAQAVLGTSIAVTTSAPVTAFSLVRLSSTTHTVNNDQRRFPLTFQTAGTNAYNVNVPSNPGIALPGAYMLFALDGDGVPSVAVTVRITGTNAPKLTSPGDKAATVGVATSLTLTATGTGTLTFGASGLPPGLALNTATGVITGTATTAGTFAVTVSAANTVGTVSTNFVWQVLAGQGPRFARLEELSEVGGNPWGSMAELNLLDLAGNDIPRAGWQVQADSVETAGEDGKAANAIDGLATTFWHSQWLAASPPPPHTFTVNMGANTALGGFRYLPRIGGGNGTIARFRFYVSADGTNWGAPVAEGDFTTMGPRDTAKTVTFGPVANRPPTVAQPAAQTSAQGQSVSLAITATDPDGDALTYTASGLPPGLSIGATSGLISGGVNAAGIFTATVVVQDTRGGSTSVSFGWTVSAPATIISAVLAPPAAAGSNVTYNAQASGQGLVYSWNFGDGTGQTGFVASASIIHTFAAPGLYSVTLSVRAPDNVITTRSFTQAVVSPAVAGTSAASSALAFQAIANGARLWVANADNNSVTAFDANTNAKLAEVGVGAGPSTLAVAGDGRLWVINRDAASISVIDPNTMNVANTIALPRASRPFGIVFAADGGAYVSLEATGTLLKLSAAGATQASVAVGPRPRHLAVNAARTRLLISRFVTPPLPGESTANVQPNDGTGGEVTVVDLATFAVQTKVILRHSERPDSTLQARGVPNYLGAAAISPDGASAWVPSKQDNVKRGKLRDGQELDFQSTVRAITSRISLTTLTEDVAARVDHDNSGVASAAAFHPSGAYLFVALETSRHVAVIDPVGRREIFRFDTGRAPQGLVLAADGLRLFVSNFMDRTVSVFDLVPLTNYGAFAAPLLGTLATITNDLLAPQVLRGKQFFYDARDTRMALEGYVSCASCHRDGQEDGRTWDLTGMGEGLRNTVSLRGRGAGHGRRHWSGNFDEVQDFEGQIRRLAGGTGLMTEAEFNAGTRREPLGDPKAGVSTDLDALAAYVNSLNQFDPSPARTAQGTLTAEATAGRAVFIAQCTQCHGGAAFTNSSQLQLFNVGTLKPSSGQRSGAVLTGIDVPTLRDAWATAPYLHDGSAATIADAIVAHNTSTLSSTQIAQLGAYVQQAGNEEPELAQAVRAQFVKLEQLTEVNGRPWGSMAEFNLVDAAGVTLSRVGWTATTDSQETVGEDGRVSNALDGNINTFWHSQWQAANPPPPHQVVVKLNGFTNVGGFRYLPRQTGPENGTIATYRFYVSQDGIAWGQPAAQGDFKTMGPVRAEKTVILR